MKKLVLLVITAMIVCNTYSQNVTRNGNVFVQTSTKNHVKDTLVTKYQYKDSSGKTYQIIINKANGRCYIWKKSKKGKLYKQYMNSSVCTTICKESNIKYKK